MVVDRVDDYWFRDDGTAAGDGELVSLVEDDSQFTIDTFPSLSSL